MCPPQWGGGPTRLAVLKNCYVLVYHFFRTGITRSLDSMNPMNGVEETRCPRTAPGGQCSGLTPCLDRQARPPREAGWGAPQSSVFSEDLGEYVTPLGEIFALYKILYIYNIKRFILAGTLP